MAWKVVWSEYDIRAEGYYRFYYKPCSATFDFPSWEIAWSPERCASDNQFASPLSTITLKAFQLVEWSQSCPKAEASSDGYKFFLWEIAWLMVLKCCNMDNNSTHIIRASTLRSSSSSYYHHYVVLSKCSPAVWPKPLLHFPWDLGCWASFESFAQAKATSRIKDAAPM